MFSAASRITIKMGSLTELFVFVFCLFVSLFVFLDLSSDIILVSPEGLNIMSGQLSPAQQLKKEDQKVDQRLYKQTRNSGDVGKSRQKMIHTNIQQSRGKD